MKLLRKTTVATPEAYCFYLPSVHIGGCEFALIRFAMYLSEELKQKVYYVDYANEETSLARRELMNTAVVFIDYTDDKQQYDAFAEPVCIVAPYTMHGQIPLFRNAKVLYWLVHPDSPKWLMHRALLTRKELRKESRKLDKHRAIACMDLACYRESQKQLDLALNKQYIPVPCVSKQRRVSPELIDEQVINLAWLGRLDGDKIYAVINLLENFNAYETPRQKRLHIIGDGDSRNLIDESLYPQVEIVWASVLVNEVLDDYLIEHVDILCAMGTSCLEGANLALPTVLLTYSLEFIKTGTFHWLYDMQDYTLGYKTQDEGEYQVFKRTPLSEIIETIYEQKQKERVGARCLAYSQNYHSLEMAARELMKHAALTSYALESPIVPRKMPFFKRLRRGFRKKMKGLFLKMIAR